MTAEFGGGAARLGGGGIEQKGKRTHVGGGFTLRAPPAPMDESKSTKT